MAPTGNWKEKERRRHTRIVFVPFKRPQLKINEDKFEIVNISETGMKFRNNRLIELSKDFKGTILFKDGYSYDIEGTVIWEKDYYVGAAFKQPFPYELIAKDNEYVYIEEEEEDTPP